MAVPWQPVGVRSVLHVRVAAEIERLIAARHLRPGDRLPPERELSRILQVGRSSLREGIAVLTARGVLTVKRGHGVYVAPLLPAPAGPPASLSRDDVRQLFAMRNVLEVAAAGWAAREAADGDIAALKAAIVALDAEATSENPDLERLQELDTDFHLLIAAMANNRFLAQMTQLLHQMLAAGMETTLSMPGRVRRSREAHLRIAGAIASHDPEAARAAIGAHLREAEAAALEGGRTRLSRRDAASAGERRETAPRGGGGP